jgi:zinc transport system ATP-binding protein
METVVKIKNVFFRYDKELVLEDVNLDIYKGDYLGIVGPNGSAKSTLLKLMLGILKPERGSIWLLGEDIQHFSRWSEIGYVPQHVRNFNFAFPATVEEVVAANLYSRIGLFRSIKKEHLEKVYDTLKIVGLENRRKELMGNLSGGQQQRIFIARALVNDPEIIFLDEPTVGIDIKSQEEFYRLLKLFNEEMGITIVMVSHDIGAINNNVNRVACMGDKKLIPHEGENIPFHKLLAQLYGNEMNILIHQHGKK